MNKKIENAVVRKFTRDQAKNPFNHFFNQGYDEIYDKYIGTDILETIIALETDGDSRSSAVINKHLIPLIEKISFFQSN